LTGIRDLLAGEVPHVALREPTLPERLDAFVRSGQQRWATLIQGLSPESAPRLVNGFYEAGLAIDGSFNIPSSVEFRDLLQCSLRNHSGWPPFIIINRNPYRPRLVDGAIESWIGPDTDGSTDIPAHHDFWRISPEGFFYTRRGLNEDGRYRGIEPGTTLDISTPTWRIGEIILQAHYVANALGAADGTLIGRFRWEGLSGRRLVSTDGRRHLSPIVRTAHQDEFGAEATMAVSTIPTSLPEIVHAILNPLYHLFDFFQLPKRLVEEELAEMMRHRF
jgi:hypothetical protein